jgi:hypothetical protein
LVPPGSAEGNLTWAAMDVWSAALKSIPRHPPAHDASTSLTELRPAAALLAPSRHFDPQARLRALQESWRDGAFHCFYTDIALVDDSGQARDHRYLVFDHRTPGDEASVVVTCALVNRMKTDLTEEQFKVMVTELAKVFADGTFDECAFPEGVAP